MPARFVALVSDPDASQCRDIVSALAAAAFCDPTEITVQSLAVAVERHRPDLVVVGVTAATSSSTLSVVARLRATDRSLPVIVIARDSSEALAIAALRAGVSDYLRDPFDPAALTDSARRCLERGAAPRPIPAVPPVDRNVAWAAHDPLIGSTAAMHAVCDYLDQLAMTDATVLITGETGTGKELAAYRVHERSRRRAARFVPVNCAAIPDGLLESELFGYEAGAFTGATRAREGLLQQADGGTIFLDEVGDLGLAAQAKILRAIETRQVYRLGGRHPGRVDVRIVAATNQDLEHAVEEQRFRKDLYFRLNVARVHLPPLRERRSDIPALIDYYLRTLNGPRGVSVAAMEPQTLEALVSYDWPGNVRELKNLIEGLLAIAPSRNIRVEDLPPLFRARLARFCSLPGAERQRIMDALFAAHWNKSRAAEILHWSRMTLYRKMAKYSVVGSPQPAEPSCKSRRA